VSDAALARGSLRTRLAWHVLGPLVLTWALGTAVLLGVAENFVGEAFDRSLLDDAYALASQVRAEHGQVTLPLSPRELATLLYDQSESQYFALIAGDGSLVAGQEALQLAAGDTPGFSEINFQGRPLRVVTVQRTAPAPFTVVMGQTTASRRTLLRRVLVYSALPQAVLLLLLALWLRRSIGTDVAPLSRLAQAIGQRHADDLAPLPPEVASAASTRDVQSIGVAVDSLLARLHRSVDAQREFAGNVAHELRTPLAAIRAHAGLGLAQDDPAAWREHLQGVGQAEQRASRMVDQLLALARAAEAGTALRRERIALDALVRELMLAFLPRADAAGVDLGAEGLDEPLVVESDRALLEGILSNLLDNALRYGRGQPPHITVGLARQDAEAVLSVCDNGPGLDGVTGDLAHRWVQGERGQRLGQGAGLGLAIVSRYASLLGGTLTLAPASGGPGLCATLRLPLPAPQNAQ